jgi:hypothetical protein
MRGLIFVGVVVPFVRPTGVGEARSTEATERIRRGGWRERNTDRIPALLKRKVYLPCKMSRLHPPSLRSGRVPLDMTMGRVQPGMTSSAQHPYYPTKKFRKLPLHLPSCPPRPNIPCWR